MNQKNTRRGFTQSCHAEFISASTPLVTIQNKEEILNQVQDDSMIRTEHAFTLIELLVVVLIIGILAAVAVPQYKKAVIKSRTATILPVLSSIIQAQDIYYLSNGQYTDNAELLDLQPPTNCTKVENDSEDGTWKCGNDWLVDIDEGRAFANYCPQYNNSYTECRPKRDFQISFGAAHSNYPYYGAPNSMRCSKFTDYGEEICKTLGKFIGSTASVNFYELY